ncbi:Protein of unknown function [Gryllus bimaculatus]|nr:Protein of unknown function [Gryllus bimaculatus]
MLARMVGVVLVSALSVKSKFDYYLNFKSPCPNIILPVKEEPMDQIEESTLNSFIKQGPNDHAKDQEDNEPYLSGREVKEDDNEEEELVFPVRVFLVEQEDEDPLTTWSKHFNRKTEWSAVFCQQGKNVTQQAIQWNQTKTLSVSRPLHKVGMK